jgi:hypothetical protein
MGTGPFEGVLTILQMGEGNGDCGVVLRVVKRVYDGATGQKGSRIIELIVAVEAELSVDGAHVSAPDVEHGLGAHRSGEFERRCVEDRIGQEHDRSGSGGVRIGHAPMVAAVRGKVFAVDFAGLGPSV